MALSRTSRRSLAARFLSSGSWHEKQFDRIGRICALKPILDLAASASATYRLLAPVPEENAATVAGSTIQRQVGLSRRMAINAVYRTSKARPKGHGQSQKPSSY